jgi:putative RNA 2'-phosphotransferase
MTDAKQAVRISKFLGRVLRHEPQSVGIVLDDAGWTSVAKLKQAAAKTGLPISDGQLDAAVNAPGKKRYAYNSDRTRIRAMQGHSVPVNLGYQPVIPPPQLYHGTHPQALDGIMKTGLKPMSRQQVHLSADIETAKIVGARRGRPTILVVDAVRAHQDGISFYLADNGVWLSDEVPARYLSFL